MSSAVCSLYFLVIDRFAFFETNPAHGNEIVGMTRRATIRNKSVIFDKSDGAIHDASRVARSSVEGKPRRPPLLPLPEHDASSVASSSVEDKPRRPPLLPLPDSNGTFSLFNSEVALTF